MEPIAIIGLSFKLPQGIENEQSFWDVLANRKNVMTPWPKSRSNIDAFYQSNASAHSTLPSKGAHFLNQDPAAFDAPFFSITAQEAASMDPQQRWLLETSYHALENAGIPVDKMAGTNTSVYSSSMTDDFMRIVSKDPDHSPLATATGTTACILANRLSWYFDLKGPSVQVNTACSSSMVALDIACQGLRSGQSSMALATGSNVLLSPETSIYLANMNFLSPDSVCYSFDHRANGYARGEGVVVLVLKRLRDAIEHGDNIRAVIRGTGSNQDGRTPGLTQPSLTSQEDLIRQVYKNAKLGFESTRYVEAHGTGTQVGDVTEARALGRIFKSSRSSKEPLYLGSVKANIGHLEGCSGLAGIVKSVLMLERGEIPPNALFEKWNPKINAKVYHIQAPTSCIPWPTKGVRRISVNSFGFGGSNGHVILDDTFHTIETLSFNGNRADLMASSIISSNWEMVSPTCSIGSQTTDATPAANANGEEYTADNLHCSELVKLDSSTPTSKNPGNCRLLIWSARDEAALGRMLQSYGEYYATSVSDGHEDRLGPLAYTLAVRRSMMNWRTFIVANTEEHSVASKISSLKTCRSSRESGLAFIFTGQGAQYVKMGLELIWYPIFRSILSRADQIFRDLGAEWLLFDELRCGERINSPEISQPLCTVLQIALVELLKSFNIVPDVVVGHSSGEIAAAYSIGALSLDSSCMVAYHRGRLAGKLIASTDRPGAMMSVNLAERDAVEYISKLDSLGGEINVACINSPGNVTLSGDEQAIDNLQDYLEDDDIFAKKVRTGVAYHSPAMSHISNEYLACLRNLQKGKPCSEKTIMISSVTGLRATVDAAVDGQYWVDNLVSPVRFADALQYLVSAAPKLDGLKVISDYVEIGPHGALQRPLKDTLMQVTGNKAFRCTSVLSRKLCPLETTMQVAGQLFAHGHTVSVSAVNQQASVANNDTPLLVDAPEYPFDHSQLYWHESRISRDWRLREAAPRSILGIPAADWNPLEPRWRKLLSIEEVPWIADHVIGDDIFFPATGMLSMAIEAVKQTAGTHSDDILGYNIKEANFMKPIVVRPESETEVVTHLRLLQHTYEKNATRFEVRLFAHMDSQWGECFRSTIHIEYKESSMEVDGGHESRMAAEAFISDYLFARSASKTQFRKDEFYKWLRDRGLKYGKLFALADDIHWDGDTTSVARVEVPQLPELFEGVIHPAVLDASCHVCVAAPSNGMTKAIPTMVPASMKNGWISARGWSGLQEVQTFSSSNLKSAEAGIECSMTVLTNDGSLLYHVDRFEMLPITGNESSTDDKRTLVYGIDWKPQLSLMSPDQLRQYCDSISSLEHESGIAEYTAKLEKILRAVLHRNMDELLKTDWSTAPAHMEQYVYWLRKQLQATQAVTDNEIAPSDLNKELADLIEEKPSWKGFAEVVRNLGSLVRGEIDSADLLASGAQISHFLNDISGNLWDRKLFAFLQLAAHQTPNQKILSVGSATCGINGHVFSALQQIERETGGIAFSKHVVVDENPASLEQCKELLAKDEDRVTFIATQDIGAQNFEPGEFDVIIVNNALSDATSRGALLKNLRTILKPGGHLVIHDLITPDRLSLTFGVGVLPGWWDNKTRPSDAFPKILESAWDSTLRECGYSGNDLVLKDYEDDAAHHASVIISKVQDSTSNTANGPRALLVVNEHELQRDVVAALTDSFLSSLGYRPEVFSVAQLADAKARTDDVVIWLADLDRPLLAEISVSSFELLKGWIKQSKNLLWVTSTERTKDIDSVLYPHSGLKDGFLRSVRLEYNDKRIISLSIETAAYDTGFCAESILKTFVAAFQTSIQSPEVEYIIRDGLTMTGRLVVDTDIDMNRNACLAPQVTTEPWNVGPPLKLDVASRGSLDTLQFVEDHDNYQPLGPTEVEISAKGWGLNFRDVFIALGRLEENDFGTDCAGVVTRVGPQCQDIQPGDRVVMCTTGCMKEFPRADQLAVARIPDSVSFETACAIIGPAITAWYSLIEVGRLQKGEKVLIHAASGATGQLAIQVAKMVGAEIFATVGFDHKKQLLKDTYGIPDNHILFSRNTSFAKGIMRLTNGAGVDVVLNSLVGDSLRASWECVAPYGRFVEIGKADIYANTSLPMGCFAKNVSFSAVDLRHIMLSRPEAARKLLLKAMELTQEGSVYSPEPLHLYDVCAVEDAFRYFQSGKNTGRTVITIDGSVNVKKHIVHRRTWSFDNNATYMVVGGLGGVGRLLLKWMVSRGAKYLIIPSRSGVASQTAAKLVDELTQEGVTIATPQCDVSSKDSFSKMLAQYADTLPPIRGCINAAMALNDSTFDKMRHAQWEGTVRSKAQTTWVLSNLLPKNLEFFISLASTTGVAGNVGAPNYAAGCAFQDALSIQRTARGYAGKSLSIDLGVMSKVGVVAETASLQRVFSESHGHSHVDDEDLLALLDVCCDPAQDLPRRSQVVMGLPTPAELISRGLDVVDALKQPLLAHFSQPRSLLAGQQGEIRPRALFQKAETDEERTEVVVRCMAQKVARAMSVEPDEVEIDKPLHVFGVDSLVAVELRNWMKNEFAAHIPVFEITGGKTIELIGELVCKVSEIRKAA